MTDAPALDSAGADLQVSPREDGTALVLSGEVTIRTIAPMHTTVAGIAPTGQVEADLSAVTKLDTAGAWMLMRLDAACRAAGGALTLTGATPQAQSLIDSVANAMPKPPPDEDTPPPTLIDRVEALGIRVTGGFQFLLALTGYFGVFLARMGRAVGHPREFRLTALVHHCEEVGFRAIPIVSLMAFLIGVVLAFQGSTQLRQFGAEVFVVDLIAISILRELGILLTAILVAGRTASAFTAAIGSMKMREEIDAMRTLGLDPVMVLFVPRILALLITLPILGLIANIAGLFGGALMSWIDLGISPGMFLTRLQEGTALSNVTVGLVKAPVFALIIGVVGCHAGMQVGRDAESLGRMTSNAVVTAIFAVIVATALFSVFFAQVGL